jgi:hypothetical protein
MKLVVAKTYSHRDEAELAKNYLEKQGIKSYAMTDDMGGARPEIGWGTGGAKVKVAEEDFRQATELLYEQPSTEQHVSTKQKKKPLALWIIVAVVLIVVIVLLF